MVAHNEQWKLITDNWHSKLMLMVYLFQKSLDFFPTVFGFSLRALSLSTLILAALSQVPGYTNVEFLVQRHLQFILMLSI